TYCRTTASRFLSGNNVSSSAVPTAGNRDPTSQHPTTTHKYLMHVSCFSCFPVTPDGDFGYAVKSPPRSSPQTSLDDSTCSLTGTRSLSPPHTRGNRWSAGRTTNHSTTA